MILLERFNWLADAAKLAGGFYGDAAEEAIHFHVMEITKAQLGNITVL